MSTDRDKKSVGKSVNVANNLVPVHLSVVVRPRKKKKASSFTFPQVVSLFADGHIEYAPGRLSFRCPGQNTTVTAMQYFYE